MLRWRPSDLLPKRIIFFLRLLALCTAVHTVFLGLLFFVYRSGFDQIIISTRVVHTDAPVVFVPWVKRVNKTPKKTEQKNKTNVQQKQLVKKVGTTLATVVAQKTSAKKMVVKHVVKQEQPVVQDKKDDVQKKIIKPVDSQKKPAQEEAKKENKQEQQEQEVQYIGRDEKDVLELQNVIVQEIKQFWHPPVGFMNDAPCMMNFFVDWDGRAQNIIIEKSSGVFAADLAARVAIESALFAKIVRGKQVSVTLE